jgi:hypothetical protein|nr:MAG TPA: hypothetical protein [Caudoviricetes sp.]
MATIDEIKQQAAAVKNATQVGENTALRVGGVLVDLCEYMKNLSDNAGSGGGGTSGGSGVSLGTLLIKLNSDNPFPTANGQVLTYDGSDFVWKTPTGSGGTSSSSHPLTIYNGSSDTDYITYDGSSAAYLKFKSGFSISKVGLGYEISVSGGGSGSSSRIKKIKLFNTHSDYSFETIDLGTADTIGFMAGNNVTLEAVVKEYTNVIKISATGGSSTGGGSVDLSSYLTKTEASTTYAAKSHNHSINDIISFTDNVKAIKVNNAENAVSANKLASSVYLWGNSFNGTNNINGNIKMGTAGGGSIQLWMNNGNMLDRTNNTLHIGYGLKESSDGEINLDANVTKIHTDNYSKHYDFKSNVFDVNSNQIHFGTDSNGGTLSWDSANKCFKINGSVYATGGITALGVSNNATTSNNLDFTFRSITADSATFDKLYLRKEYGYGLFVGTKCALWGALETDAIHFGGNFTQVYMTEWVVLNSNSKQCYFATRIQSAKGLSLLDGYLDVNYNGTTYKFDFAKAKELGLLIGTGVKTLSDEVDYANVIQ